jgi:hypothetical protein
MDASGSQEGAMKVFGDERTVLKEEQARKGAVPPHRTVLLDTTLEM